MASIEFNYRHVSVLQFARELKDKHPIRTFERCRQEAAGTKRDRSYSKYDPHYGKQAAQRNLKHIANCTHGY